MADWHIAHAETWTELVAFHDRFIADYNFQIHRAHRDRQDGRHLGAAQRHAAGAGAPGSASPAQRLHPGQPVGQDHQWGRHSGLRRGQAAQWSESAASSGRRHCGQDCFCHTPWHPASSHTSRWGRTSRIGRCAAPCSSRRMRRHPSPSPRSKLQRSSRWTRWFSVSDT